ncbi:polyisoprenoid-binding protein [Actinocrinis puniceicyclus]|uniref:Polyisoprenoid-binding protein n=1 Tax=Actinocrinis puniceicyclus TaxID=977794 RepID=A0A8J8BGI9_9ACTN|nr:YceI family protein [Actinocrinis puniceicyclus]MBS2965814.1 polyisoprenoid-binding protein [Actinocrinis puniceicyclus]
MTSTASTALTGAYSIDPVHSRIGFTARHAMVTKVHGSFSRFTGAGTFDVEDPSRSTLQLTIDGASIDTHNADRDAHLRSNDFLDLEHYPQITFNSTSVQQVEPDTYRVTGDLTIKGVTRPVTFDLVYTGSAVDPYGNQRVGWEGRTTINRKDWGVNWNAALEAGGMLVSEKVTLEFDISAVKDAAAGA